jgi:hypothetical protein
VEPTRTSPATPPASSPTPEVPPTATSIPTAPPAPTDAPPPAPPTAAPNVGLTGVCTDNPYALLRWRVTGQAGLSITWDIYGSALTGTLQIPSSGEAFFLSETLPNNPNIARVFVGGDQVANAGPNFEVCIVPPTPTPEPTSTATPEPTNSPNPDPSPPAPPSPPDSPPGPPPSDPPAATPTPEPTITPTPRGPTFWLSGKLKTRNGREFSDSLSARLAGLNLSISITNRATKERTPVSFENGWVWRTTMPEGRYTIRLVDPTNRLAVISRPQHFILRLRKDTGNVNFAVRFRTDRGAQANAAKSRSRRLP